MRRLSTRIRAGLYRPDSAPRTDKNINAMKKKSYIFIAAALTVCAGVSCQKNDIYIDVEQDLYEVPAVYTELNIPVRCNTSSTAAVRYDGEETGWILLLPSLLGGDGVYSLWIEENQSEAETRSATLVITAGTS